MIFRERQERVAFMDAVTQILGRVFGLDARRVYGDIVAEYAQETFQETYDVDLLRQKIANLREAQRRIKERRTHDQKMLTRLDRLGQYYDLELGLDLKPLPSRAKQ